MNMTAKQAQSIRARRTALSAVMRGTVVQCPLCHFEWTRMPSEDTRFCYGCWDAGRTYTIHQTAESSAEDIAAFLWECAENTNRTEAAVRRLWRALVAEVAMDESKS